MERFCICIEVYKSHVNLSDAKMCRQITRRRELFYRNEYKYRMTEIEIDNDPEGSENILLSLNLNVT